MTDTVGARVIAPFFFSFFGASGVSCHGSGAWLVRHVLVLDSYDASRDTDAG